MDNSPHITEHGIRSLAALGKLHILSLRRCPITSDSAQFLSRLTALRGLILSETELDDEGFQKLQPLGNLRWIQVNATGIKDLGPDLCFPALEYLSAADTNLSDKGVQRLSHCPKLAFLDISNTQVTNASIGTLASIASLRSVNVHGTKIDQESPEWQRFTSALKDKRVYDSRPNTAPIIESPAESYTSRLQLLLDTLE
ncbi:MAG: hypothetical protein ACQESR_29345 [Planctomycetota bacterium]